MAMGKFQRMAHERLGRLAESGLQRNPQLPLSLQRAHILVRPDVYLSSVYAITLGAVATGLILALLVGIAAVGGAIEIPLRTMPLLVLFPLVAGSATYFIGLSQPTFAAKGRARVIDAKLPYALNYISTMASAGATPQRIFATLAKQDIYGEVADEAAWIDRDISLLGHDLLSALSAAIDRSPSQRFKDLLQGAITVLTSGGELKEYFLAKAEQFLVDNRQDQKRFIESLGVLAESFVVVVVAAPLFIIVVLSVMTLFGTPADEVLTIGYAIILLMLPLSQAGFAVTIKSMTPEA